MNTLTDSPKGTVYDFITERITSLLEQGVVPWHKPWNARASMPRNLLSKQPYHGVNVFLLLSYHYECPFWLTFRQVQELGGTVRKGEKAARVVFWKQTKVEDEKTEETKTIRVLRYYHVFNATQCEGLKNIPMPTEQPASSIPKPAEIIERMPQRPTIKHGMTHAYYSPRQDCVGMPMRERFSREEDYYSTLFHELAHSTGHADRLNRPTVAGNAGFGSDPYGKEELIAEMGAAFLCAHAGIVDRTIDNSAAYLSGWLEQLRKDNKLIVKAATQAQKAADFVLGNLDLHPEESAAPTE